MSRAVAIALSLGVLASPAWAQTPDPHARHVMPQAAPPADPHAGHVMPAPDPHAGHVMPQSPPAADPHAGHSMAAPAPAGDEAPPPPEDHAADRVFSPAEMAAARAVLAGEHGDMAWSKVMIDRAEYRPGGHGDGYAWDARASWGGDIDRFVLKSEGEGASHHLEAAEVEGLYSRAISPYFNLEAGVRQDLQPRPRRTYAVLGVKGLAPYWFDVEARIFLSDRGDLSARLEAAYDLRLTQRWILQPRAEANLAAQNDRAAGVGSGLSDLELGLRLHYALTPEFAPYVGVNWSRKLGDTADFARTTGKTVGDTRLVVGLRAWF